jgi:signal peptidase I
VQKVSYWFGGEPQRGDVIVFKDPGDWLPPSENDEPTSLLSKGLEKIGLYPSGGHLVKRVIGVPGDTIHCCNDAGQLEINGVAVDESSFVKPGAPCDGPMVLPRCSQAGWTVGPVPAGTLFVMGDNRANSGDSSAHLSCSRTTCTGADAFVPEDDVVGKVFALVWPIKRFTFVSRPDVFSNVPSPSS